MGLLASSALLSSSSKSVSPKELIAYIDMQIKGVDDRKASIEDMQL